VVALELAARHPEQVAAVVLCNPLPLIDGFQWHGPRRIWRRPGLGELMMGATNRWLFGRTLRRGSTRPDVWTAGRVGAVWKQFDQGTQRATLRLHRGTDPRRLESDRARLSAIEAPALIVWGEADPWLSVELADRFGGLLPNATVERVAGAGHWPWLDRPEVADRIAGF
jgi:pimeloyl-ACP methyl ester carboxylesterase